MTPLHPQPAAAAPLSLRAAVGFGFAAVAGWYLSNVLLVTFAAMLVALALCSIARPITRYAGVPRPLAILIAAAFFVLVVGWPFFLFGSRLWRQFDELAVDIPQTIETIKLNLESHPSVVLLEKLSLPFDMSTVAAPMTARLTNILSSIGSVLAYLTLLMFAALYFALSPTQYVDGILRLVPADYRSAIRQFLERAARLLRLWLSTQLVVVVLNALFTGIGLWLFGVEEAGALAMLAGLLSFIPYVGTIIAMGIAALAVMPQGVTLSLYVLFVFTIASAVEGYLITPYIQSRTLSLAPVVLIVAIFTFGVLFGTLGIILAAPLTVVIMAALDTFYVPNASPEKASAAT